jgi:hypothetical protein
MAPATKGNDADTWLWGFIDRTGKWVIEPKFNDALSYSSGLAAVLSGVDVSNPGTMAGRWGYIDTSGKYVIQPQFFDANPFSGGLASVAFPTDDPTQGRAAYIDLTGKTVWMEP